MTLRSPPASEDQVELFSAMFNDITARDARDAMEMPFLSLSKQPRFRPIHYASHGLEVTVSGGPPYGIATIWDWDLIMWLLAQVRQAIDRGEPVSRRIAFHRYAFLKDARRAQGGSQYQRLEDSIARLKNTTVVTTIRATKRRTVMFSWIEFADIERDENGHLARAIVVLPEWLFDAVSNCSLVLSLHRDYFLLTGGIERWLYRFVRKGAGRNRGGWRWRMRTLHERSGTTQDFKYFAREVRSIAAAGKLLDYKLQLVEERGETYLHARRIGSDIALKAEPARASMPRYPSLRTTTYEHAKRIAPTFDIYTLERDWREATTRNGIELKNPDGAFLAWCKQVASRRIA
jgi:plasmid replication initiation protein